MHLVGFIIRIYHDARPSECQNRKVVVAYNLRHKMIRTLSRFLSSDMDNNLQGLFKACVAVN